MQIKVYTKPSGVSPFLRALEKLDPGTRAAVESALRRTLNLRREDWHKLGRSKKLVDYSDIYEFRMKINKVQVRPIFTFFRNDIVLMHLGSHKDKIYQPTDLLKVSQKLQKDMSNGRGSINDYTI